MTQPTKQDMHDAIDQLVLDGPFPIVFIAFNPDGESISFFYGDQGQLVPLMYDVLGKVMFAPPQAQQLVDPDFNSRN